MWGVVKDGRIRPHNLFLLGRFFSGLKLKGEGYTKIVKHAQQAAIGNQNGFCFQVPHHKLLGLMLAVGCSDVMAIPRRVFSWP